MSIRKLLFSIAAFVTVSAANCAVAHAAEGADLATAAAGSEIQPQTEEKTESEQSEDILKADGELMLFTDLNQNPGTQGAAAAVYEQIQDENAAGTSPQAADQKDNAKDTETSKGEDASGQKETEKKDAESKETGKKAEAAYTKEDLKLLTCLVYAEAGNQSYKGKLAVANVVLNRKNNTQSHMFGHANTIEDVVYDKKWGVQFSVTKGGNNSSLAKALKMYESGKYRNKAEKKAMQECEKAAEAALKGENDIGDYLFFRVYNKATEKKYSDHLIIEDHIFYNAN